MLEVNEVDVSYGKMQVLWKVSFSVERGEVVSIVGPNGSGKTTILRTISGLLHPSRGSINFLKERIDRLPPHEIVRKGISFIPEDRKLFPEMTVIENIELGAYFAPENIKKEKLQYVFNLFPLLKERRNQQVKTLSGGEQRMVAIARGLMSNPKLLMLDEPSFGLAPLVVKKIFNIIEELKKQGITILLVEQNVSFALKVADKILAMEKGRIVFSGSPQEALYNNRVKKIYLGL
ncbi:MAG: ABC transporter ATP-binding protein [Candidatus Bathyarchaeia archaeon]